MYTLVALKILLHDLLLTAWAVHSNIVAVIPQVLFNTSARQRGGASKPLFGTENGKVVHEVGQHYWGHVYVGAFERSSVNRTCLGDFEGVGDALGTERVATGSCERFDKRRLAYRTAEVVVYMRDICKTAYIERIGRAGGVASHGDEQE